MVTDAAAQPKKQRILLVDDHPIVCRGLRLLIDDEPDMEVCGEAGEVPEALRKVNECQPDVVIVDLALKLGHGLELIQQIKAHDARIRILVSSMHDESLFAERCLRAGAAGYISKQESSEKIIEAIRRVVSGEIYLSSRMASGLIQRVTGAKAQVTDPVATLTDRELEVFELIGQGHSTKQIALKLALSRKTVESHREKIKLKLNLSGGSELVRRATQWVLENG